MKFLNTHLAAGQSSTGKCFLQKPLSDRFQRQALSLRLSLQAGFGLGIQLNFDGHSDVPLPPRVNALVVKC